MDRHRSYGKSLLLLKTSTRRPWSFSLLFLDGPHLSGLDGLVMGPRLETSGSRGQIARARWFGSIGDNYWALW